MQPTLSKLLLIILVSFPAFVFARHSSLLTENKGQVRNQFLEARPDIQYAMHGGDVSVFIGNGQLHYQWYRSLAGNGPDLTPDQQKDEKTEIYRMDVVLLGANTNAPVLAEGKGRDYELYYKPYLPFDGVTVYGYQKISYKNIYPNIDWVLYADNGHLKYDFIVHPGGKVSDIRLQYTGGETSLGADGAITASTPFGSITEQKPYSYNVETKQTVVSAFVLKENILSFDLSPYSGTVVIDPVVNWITYYGGNEVMSGSNFQYEWMPAVASDAAGNAYVAGSSYASNNIATTGAFQTTYAGWRDGFIAKFDEQGVRQWGTYYGGNNSDCFGGIDLDPSGNIFAAGPTTSAGLATPGAHKTSGQIIIAKFTNSGARIWATYHSMSYSYGLNMPVACDPSGNVYIAHSFANILKLTGAGAFGWDTSMYPASKVGDIACDAAGNVYWAGEQYGSGFVGKTSPTGVLIWSALSGNSNATMANGVSVDTSGNVYISGHTIDNTGIATPGAHRTTIVPSATVGGYDGFVIKYNSAGSVQWGSYYGGFDTNHGHDVAVTPTGRVFHSGVRGFKGELYMLELNPLDGAVIGNTSIQASPLQYGYYMPLSYSANGNIYATSWTEQSTGVATPGAHQTTMSGNFDPVLLSIRVDTTVAITEPFTDTLLCAGDTFKLPYTVGGTFNSNNVFAVYMSDSNGSFVTLTPVGWIMQTGADTIVCTIPANTLPGSNYRVIIISMSPAWASAPNEYPIRIDTAKQPSVTIAASPGLTVGPWVPVTFTATISGGGSAPIYQWKKNGIDIAGANAATYKGVSAIDFTTNDNITCVMTSNSACATVKSASSNSLTLNVTLGIDQPGSGKDISLYPNPNKGDFTLSGVDTYNNLEITDVTGRIIHRADIAPGAREMKISLGKQVASGHYFVRLTSAQATAMLKLTIN